MTTIHLPCKLVDGELQRFCDITSSGYGGESFFAPNTALTSVSIWLCDPLPALLKIDILDGGVQGRSIATGFITPGDAGKRTLTFPTPVYVEQGHEYVLRVMSGAPELQCVRIALADQVEYDGCGIIGGIHVEGHLAVEFTFDTFEGEPPIRPIPPEVDPAYREAVVAALRERRDVWGEELIASGGVTYDNIKDKLHPLMLSGSFLTESGVYYVPFGFPDAPDGAEDYTLLVADGSQIITRSSVGAKLSFYLKYDGREELYGSDLTRLAEPAFADGWKPILLNSYTLNDGTVVTKETFVSRIGKEPVAFVKLVSTAAVTLRLAYSDAPIADGMVSVVSACPNPNEIPLPANTPVYLARFNSPVSPDLLPEVTEARFEAEKRSLLAYWNEKLDNGTVFSVPEERAMNIQRALLIQNLMMGWRYSIGNFYEVEFQPESNDAADVLTMYGFTKEGLANFETLLHKKKIYQSYSTWEKAEKLSHAARYYDLSGDPTLFDKYGAVYKEYLRSFAEEAKQSEHGLLMPQAFSADIAEAEIYTHWCTVTWQAIHTVARILNERNDPDAEEFSALSASFTAALEKAMADSVVQVEDDVWFVPEKLVSGVKTYFDPITATRIGSYWNLCIYYSLASGFFDPSDPITRGVFEYIKRYGAWFLGLLRFNYYPVEVGTECTGGLPGYKTPGADNVYAINMAEFTAQMDDPERLILMFYGKMAHGMTRGTYVSGEGDTIQPASGEWFRSLYLPPSSANNSVYLKLLRDLLICEALFRKQGTRELRLLFSTPRDWLADGKEITVENAPTLFGSVSVKAVSKINRGIVTASVNLNVRTAPDAISIRLRVPQGKTLQSVTVNGTDWIDFDPETSTIALGTLDSAEIEAHFA